MQKKLLLIGLGLAAGLIVIWLVAFARPYQLHGSEITPAVAAPDFTLSGKDGSSYHLGASAGKISLVFFGYTTCPDICPTTLSDFKQTRAALGSAADQVEFIFITVDPQRDTPQRTGEYAAGFDAAFIGLSGSEAELDPVWSAYGVYHAIQPGQSAAGYLVDHSTRVYLVDQQRNLRLTYAYGTPPDDIAADVRYLLKQ